MTDNFKNENYRETISLALPLFLLTSVFFLNFTIRIILAPLMPTLLTDMNLAPDQASSFFLISAAGYFGTGFVIFGSLIFAGSAIAFNLKMPKRK
jgi:fucose permease